jgi:elongation factor 1-alpha
LCKTIIKKKKIMAALVADTNTEKSRQHLGIVIVGHVDAGKSTTTGHLLFKLGGISSREMEKLQAEADANGKGSFAYAYYMDKQKDERARGVTISCSTKEFFTKNIR